VGLERKIVLKHFGAILAAVVSCCAIIVSLCQVYITKQLGDENAQTLRDQVKRQYESQQDQLTTTRELKKLEEDARARETSLKLAQFLADHQAELLSADPIIRKRMETILFATFDAQTIIPVLERLKVAQLSPQANEQLHTLLERAKEVKAKANEVQPQNGGSDEAVQPTGEEGGKLAIHVPRTSPAPEPSFEGVTDSSPRTALVIGNSNYLEIGLKNATKDALDMAKALRGLGFDVISGTDLSLKEMKRLIHSFGEKLRANRGVGLFYYAGHGVELQGVNYLIPIDANIKDQNDMEVESLNANFVVSEMRDASNPLNILVLDTCRNNPFGSWSRSIHMSSGLAEIQAPRGTIIAYSTGPASVASDGPNKENGVYTHELLKVMPISGLNIEEVFKRVRISVVKLTQGQQVPWEVSSLVGNFSFAKKEAAAPASVSPDASTP
jgi:hypothetical protein